MAELPPFSLPFRAKNSLVLQLRLLLDSPDRDDVEVELPVCTLGINPDLCDRALCLAARANLRVLGRAAKSMHTRETLKI